MKWAQKISEEYAQKIAVTCAKHGEAAHGVNNSDLSCTMEHN